MLGELEQCSCGILFDTPLIQNEAFTKHMDDRLHDFATTVSKCGPCYFGACSHCEHSRETRLWHCRCDHRSAHGAPSNEEAHEMTVTWSNFLAARMPMDRTG